MNTRQKLAELDHRIDLVFKIRRWMIENDSPSLGCSGLRKAQERKLDELIEARNVIASLAVGLLMLLTSCTLTNHIDSDPFQGCDTIYQQRIDRCYTING